MSDVRNRQSITGVNLDDRRANTLANQDENAEPANDELYAGEQEQGQQQEEEGVEVEDDPDEEIGDDGGVGRPCMRSTLNCFGGFGGLGVNFNFGFQLKRSKSWTAVERDRSASPVRSSRSRRTSLSEPVHDMAYGGAATAPIATTTNEFETWWRKRKRKNRRPLSTIGTFSTQS